MILEPGHRFFKQYDLVIGARKTSASPLPLTSDISSVRTVESLLHHILSKGPIRDRGDRDLIELVSVSRTSAGNLVLFFHREALKAADPIYRTSSASGDISVSKYKKRPDEEQAVSCHLVISPAMRKGGYPCALEEVPGLNMGAVLQVLRKKVFAFSHYKFKNPKGGKEDETYATIKAVGYQSEKLQDALKTSRWSKVTLSKPADKNIVDGIPFLKPKPQTMEIRVDAALPKDDAFNYVKKLAQQAFGAGWEDFRVDIDFDDERSKGVSVDRNTLGRDIMFVRSKRIDIRPEIENCSVSIVPQVIAAAEKIL